MVRVIVLAVTVVVIVVEREIGVIALNQASARRVVLGSGECKAGVLRQRIDGLHQSFTEGDFADNQAAIVVLDRSGDDFGRRCRAAIHQHHQRIIPSTVTMGRNVPLFR